MELVLRTIVVYVLLWAVVRGTGKRELAELGPFDLVLLIVLGDVIQQAITQEDMSITGGFIVLATMGLLVVAIAELIRRSARARRIIEGSPTTVVAAGPSQTRRCSSSDCRWPICSKPREPRASTTSPRCATRSSSRTGVSRSSPTTPRRPTTTTTRATSADPSIG